MFTPETFCMVIEQFVANNPGVTYLDAIQHYCDRNQVDYETIPRLLTGDMKDKLRSEALDKNLLTIKKAQLPPAIPLD